MFHANYSLISHKIQKATLTLLKHNHNNQLLYFDNEKRCYTKKCWVVLTQFWVKYGQTQLLH